MNYYKPINSIEELETTHKVIIVADFLCNNTEVAITGMVTGHDTDKHGNMVVEMTAFGGNELFYIVGDTTLHGLNDNIPYSVFQQ